jgi:hypothetical protein
MKKLPYYDAIKEEVLTAMAVGIVDDICFNQKSDLEEKEPNNFFVTEDSL